MKLFFKISLFFAFLLHAHSLEEEAISSSQSKGPSIPRSVSLHFHPFSQKTRPSPRPKRGQKRSQKLPSRQKQRIPSPQKISRPPREKRRKRHRKFGPSLLKKRDRAILKGMRWMRRYIERHWSYDALGLDAVYIFMELAQTSRNPLIRHRAQRYTHLLAQRMNRYFLRPKVYSKFSNLFDILDLLAEAPQLHFRAAPLFRVARKEFRKIKSDRKLYQTDLQLLSSLTSDDLFDLLINAYILTKVNLRYPRQFPSKFTLYHVLKFLKTYHFTSYEEDPTPDKEHFSEDAFLATHIAYVINNYGRLALKRQDLPVVYPYLRKNFEAILKDGDGEIIAEMIDVFRSMGFDETNDKMVRKGTLFLLRKQHHDGSWGQWRKEKDPYDAIHETWCAVLGLRERFFLKKTKYARKISAILLKIRRKK